MSKKDYQLIADAILEACNNYPCPAVLFTELVNSFVRKLAEDNPLFSSDRFREACK